MYTKYLKNTLIILIVLLLGFGLGVASTFYLSQENAFEQKRISGDVRSLELIENIPNRNALVGVLLDNGNYIQIAIVGKEVGGNLPDTIYQDVTLLKLNDRVEAYGGMNFNKVEGKTRRSLILSNNTDYIKKV